MPVVTIVAALATFAAFTTFTMFTTLAALALAVVAIGNAPGNVGHAPDAKWGPSRQPLFGTSVFVDSPGDLAWL